MAVFAVHICLRIPQTLQLISTISSSARGGDCAGPHAQSSILLPRDHAPHMSAVSEWSDAGWILRVPSPLAVTSHSWAAEPSGSSMVTGPLSSSERTVSAFPLDLSVIVYEPLPASRSNVDVH